MAELYRAVWRVSSRQQLVLIGLAGLVALLASVVAFIPASQPRLGIMALAVVAPQVGILLLGGLPVLGGRNDVGTVVASLAGLTRIEGPWRGLVILPRRRHGAGRARDARRRDHAAPSRRGGRRAAVAPSAARLTGPAAVDPEPP